MVWTRRHHLSLSFIISGTIRVKTQRCGISVPFTQVNYETFSILELATGIFCLFKALKIHIRVDMNPFAHRLSKESSWSILSEGCAIEYNVCLEAPCFDKGLFITCVPACLVPGITSCLITIKTRSFFLVGPAAGIFSDIILPTALNMQLQTEHIIASICER